MFCKWYQRKLDEKDAFIQELVSQIVTLSDEILRLKTTPIRVQSDEMLFKTDQEPITKDMPKPLPWEITSFINEIEGIEAQNAVRDQAYAMMSAGVSEHDLARYIIQNNEDPDEVV